MDSRGLGKRIQMLHMLRRRMMHEQNHQQEIVPGQYPLLNFLSRYPDASQQELAAMLFVTPASVAQSTKRLQNAGLLRKVCDPGNLRKNRLRITPAGQSAVESFHSLVDTVNEATFRDFNEAEIQQLLSYHNRMIQNLATAEDLDLLRKLESTDRRTPAETRIQSTGNGGK